MNHEYPDFSVFDRTAIIKPMQHQQVLDASARLQAARSNLAAQVARGRRTGVRLFGPGPGEVNRGLYEESETWRQYISIRPWLRAAELSVNLQTNRARARSADATSVYDINGTTLAARLVLSGEKLGRYLLGIAPIQLKLVEGREAFVDGPFVDEQPTVMAVSDPAFVVVAQAYADRVIASASPPQQFGVGFPGLSDRHRQVVGLLSEESTDDQIAEALGVSVRTVRTDVAALMEVFGVGTRFALGGAVMAQQAALATVSEASPES